MYYMIFRATVPPGFKLDEYEKRSSEPIRYDAVTVVEADSAREAVEMVISATGLVTTGFAACEVELIDFNAKSQSFGIGGALRKKPEGPKQLTPEEKVEKLQKQIDDITAIGEDEV